MHPPSVDGYRVTRDVALPYVMPGTTTERHSIDDDLDLEGTTRKARFINFFHSLHASIVKDFTPLTQISLPTIRPLSNRSRPSPRPSAASKKDSSKHLNGEDSSSPSGDEDEEDEGDGDSSDEEQERMVKDLEQAEEMQENAREGAAGVDEGWRESQQD